ncbi:tetratricopeptide repeat protein [Labilibaculum sp. DW002]|uniref:Tetratricopeptide repeat protein n=1 Tax=Paralabilibaculum antarcticum TaxID=2912572 RepID=A0ABT5VNI3_9BACT|nr:tetratricopeptide repeat protein [Labilibaculum sp. DW002]MDE5416805.1 tetratricopeptide repeat protein [Labilibaculum sp. DW002]
MEILRIIKYVLFSLIMLILEFSSLSGQNFETVRTAFDESYKYEKEGDFSHALEQLKEVYDEDSYEINLRLGWLNYQAGVFTEAIAHYQRAINLKPYAEEAKFGLVLPKAAMGKWTEVVNLYKEILEISPNQTVANYRLGLIYYGQESYEMAHFHFKKVVDLYPFKYDALIMLAWTNYHMGKSREALVLFEKSLWYFPHDLSAMEGLKLLKTNGK